MSETRSEAPDEGGAALSATQLAHLQQGVLEAVDWTPFYVEKIKQVFSLAFSATPSSAGSADSIDSQRAVAEHCADICEGRAHDQAKKDTQYGKARAWDAFMCAAAIRSYAATLPAAPKDVPKDREEPR